MRLSVLILLLILSGCAGAPTVYLDLTPDPPVPPPRAARVPALAVSTIDLPPAIDRLHLTTSGPSGALHVAGKTEWAGPLGPMARIVLAQDLSARLSNGLVLMPGDAIPPGGAATVHVTMQDFMPDAEGTVTLQADWAVTAADGRTSLARGRFARRVTGSATPTAEAKSMSIALGQLADAIAAALARQA